MTEQLAAGANRKAGTETATAYLLLTVAMLSWSGNVVIARALVGTVPPLGLSLMRWVVAFAVVLPFAARELSAKRSIIRARWPVLLLLGLLGLTLCNSLSYVGVQWTTAINVALVNAVGPILTLAVSFLLYGERVTWGQIAGMLTSIAGVAVIVLRGDPAALFRLSINLGDVVVLIAVTTWSVYTVLLRRRPPELSPLALLAVLFAIGALTLLPLHLVESALGRPLPMTGPALLGYAYVGLFPAVIAFFGWNRGVAVIGPNRASFFSYLMPLFSAALAYLFLGEAIAPYHLAGGGLVFLGIFLVNRRSGA